MKLGATDEGPRPAGERLAAPLDVSVLIATRDRVVSLGRLLDGLAEAPPALRWQLIVVDNGSRDATPRLLRALADRLPLVVLEEPRTGKNRALNRAVAAARGALLVFTDDDVVPAPGWIAAFERAASAFPNAAAFGGPIEPLFPEATPTWMSDPGFALASEAFGRKAAEALGYTRSLPFGANLALRAGVFERYRFSESIGPGAGGAGSYAQGSEYELLMRLRAAGERIVHVPDARVGHLIAPEQVTVEWLLGRAERVGRGSARLKGKHVPRSFVGWAPLLFRRARAEWSAVGAHRRPDAEHFEAARHAHYWRGYVAEARRLRGERAALAARARDAAGGPMHRI